MGTSLALAPVSRVQVKSLLHHGQLGPSSFSSSWSLGGTKQQRLQRLSAPSGRSLDVSSSSSSLNYLTTEGSSDPLLPASSLTPSCATTATINDSIPLSYNSSLIDFDQLQKVDILSTITEHVEEIGSDIVFPNQEDLRSQGETSDSIGSLSSSITVHDAMESPTSFSTSVTSEVQTSSSTNSKKRTQFLSNETRKAIHQVTSIALPSLGGMLLDPIMSLIDTACVGQVSTTALAAMAPCTSIFQFAFFAFFFLSAATTNLVAGNPPEGATVVTVDENGDKKKVMDWNEAAKRVDFNERVVSSASLLAVLLGSMVTFSLVKFADPLLKLAGIPATNTALLNAARPYLLIRAMGIPFVFLATVLQGSSLGRGDAWRPLKIFGAAGVVNLVGDVWLTLFKGWGATGAATATIAAQIGAAIYYVITSMRLDKSVEESSKPLRDVALVWRGLPTKSMVKTFMNVAVALFSRSIGLMLAYSMLTRTAALSGTMALAAHQVTLQVWWLMSFLPEPMSVAAQTLITRDMKDRPDRVPRLIKTLFGMSSVLGVAAAAATCVILRAPGVASALVADVSVQKLMASLVPFAVLSQSYCPLATLSDGVCIGLGSFAHLPSIMVGSFLTTAAGLAVVASRGLGVVGVWGCMNVFIASRIVGHVLLSTKLRQYVKKAFGRNKHVDQVLIPEGVAP
ncbi:hypothetical protein ACHAXS_009740 [Conticribra weissflogii]